MVQTAVTNEMPIGVSGGLADSDVHSVLSYSNVLPINFGVLVVNDATADGRAKAPVLTTDITVDGAALGIALQDVSVEGDTVNVGYPASSAIKVLRRGRVLMRVEDAVTEGAVPFFRFTAPGVELLGAVRSDADVGKAAQLPAGSARFETSATAGSLVVVSIHLA